MAELFAGKNALLAAVILNLLMVLVTAFIVLVYFQVGKGTESVRGFRSLRFFTVESNLFSALTCAVMAVLEMRLLATGGGPEVLPHWAVLLKYLGTCTVTLTMVTVFAFLGPTQGFGNMLVGANFHLHLAGPLMAILTFILLEKGQEVLLPETLLGVLPTIAYGFLYRHMVIGRGEWKGGWEDFYGFNRGGKWRWTFVIMVLASFLLCLALRALHNA